MAYQRKFFSQKEKDQAMARFYDNLSEDESVKVKASVSSVKNCLFFSDFLGWECAKTQKKPGKHLLFLFFLKDSDDEQPPDD